MITRRGGLGGGTFLSFTEFSRGAVDGAVVGPASIAGRDLSRYTAAWGATPGESISYNAGKLLGLVGVPILVLSLAGKFFKGGR